MIAYCDTAGRNAALRLVEPRLSICFGSRKPTTATELEDSPSVYNRSNKKSDGSICLSFMYLTRKKSRVPHSG